MLSKHPGGVSAIKASPPSMRRSKMSIFAHGNCKCAVHVISDRRSSLKSRIAIDTNAEQHRAGGLFCRVFHSIRKPAIPTAWC
ncbi:hypothetical protein [Mesorhizobium sp. M0098]|uniref:hypothetical protein n=1 Tax=Mesorhizobium sp. M0098 TaxID=2956878 RepID=UPI0033355FCA